MSAYSHPEALQEWRQRWATAIRQRRTETLRMSQHELARHLGSSQATVGMWETAKAAPEDLMKVRLIVMLDLDAAEMFRPLEADPIGQSDRGMGDQP